MARKALTEKEVITLRKQIVLNSLYLSDYENDMYVNRDAACAFFDGFMDFIQEKAEEDGFVLDGTNWKKFFEKYDTVDNLIDWWNCFEECPLYAEQDEEWSEDEFCPAAA